MQLASHVNKLLLKTKKKNASVNLERKNRSLIQFSKELTNIIFFVCYQPQRKNVPIDDDVYDALLLVLSGAISLFQDWPKTDDPSLRQRVYRKWKSGFYEIRDVHDPMAGKIANELYTRPQIVLW